MCVRWSVPRKSRVTILLLYEVCGVAGAIGGSLVLDESVCGKVALEMPDPSSVGERLDHDCCVPMRDYVGLKLIAIIEN